MSSRGQPAGRPALRVMLVDSCAELRHALAKKIEGEPSLYFVGSAINARTALAKVDSYRPDVVLVDCVTPGGGGAVLARMLVEDVPDLRVVPMLADHTDAARWLDVEHLDGLVTAVRSRLEATTAADLAGLVHAATPAAARAATRATARTADAPRDARAPRIVAIGCSTGGPEALSRLLPAFPADFPLPIAIVQHMPPKFTASLAAALDRSCAVQVQEAQAGQLLRPGNAYVAPGGYHLAVVESADGVATKLSQAPPEHSCRPAVDFLLRSVAQVYGGSCIAVILTGMGCDGLAGCQLLHDAGARVFAQDEATCTVFGMPRGPIERGIAEAVPLHDMANHIQLAAKVAQLR